MPATHTDGAAAAQPASRRIPMRTFDTPEPITVAAEFGVGELRVVAGDAAETTVEVRPGNPNHKADLTAAEQTRVEYDAGRLLVKGPKGWRSYAPWAGGGSIEVVVGCPAGSRLEADTGVGQLRGSGRLGECRCTMGVGDIRLERTGPVQLSTGAGDVEVGRVAGHAEVSSGSGALRIGFVDGPATIKGGNGDLAVGEITGDLELKAANGRITVGTAHGSVSAKTAKGDVTLAEVCRGSVDAQTAYGSVEIGVREGVAAWLEVDTRYGSLLNGLEESGAPAPGEDTVEVRAGSHYGNVTIRRAAVHGAGGARA
jgi:hypothetical protein